MAKILVTIITRNNLPNYLFIKQMDRKTEKHIFIVTSAVEAKEACWLAKAVGGERCQNRKTIKFTDEDDYVANVKTLEAELGAEPGDSYIVNLTGGTKAMALAVHDVLAKYDSQFFCLTQNGKFIYDFQKSEKKLVTERISLVDYLALYDISLEKKGTPSKEEDAGNMFRRLAAKNFDKTKCPEIVNGQQHPNQDMRVWLMGEWFEAYCYFRLRKDFGLADDAIAQGVAIVKSADSVKKGGDGVNGIANDNEIDVIFVKDNVLYTIECKVGVKSSAIGDTQYKAAAISKYIGFGVRSYIFWLQDLRNCDEKSYYNIKRRVNYLGMSGIVTGNDLLRGDNTYLDNPEIR